MTRRDNEINSTRNTRATLSTCEIIGHSFCGPDRQDKDSRVLHEKAAKFTSLLKDLVKQQNSIPLRKQLTDKEITALRRAPLESRALFYDDLQRTSEPAHLQYLHLQAACLLGLR